MTQPDGDARVTRAPNRRFADAWRTLAPMSALMIGIAGGVGSVLRYAVTLALGRALGSNFPFGTLCVNVIGSFLLGVVAEALSGATIVGVDARLVLGVGVMGGFTTYSSFNLEALRMLERGDFAKAGLYVGATLVVCLAAGALGVWVARVIVSAHPG